MWLPPMWIGLSRHCSALSKAREIVSQIASLDGVRGVLRLAGPDIIGFLQGQLTNDVRLLAEDGAPPMYAAMLNSHGRFQHDMFLYRQPGNKPVILADVDAASADRLLQTLKRSRLRSNIELQDLSEDFKVWTRFGSGQLQEGHWSSDPRLPLLGQRAVLGAEDRPSFQGDEQQTDPVEYRRWRIEQGVAEGQDEIEVNSIPFAYNMDGLNAISFDKGCYLGQELIARTHYTGVVRRRLVPFVAQEGDLVPGRPAVEVQSAAGGKTRKAGNIVISDRGRGLAVLSVDSAIQAEQGEISLQVADGGARITPWIPQWWPERWRKQMTDTQPS